MALGEVLTMESRDDRRAFIGTVGAGGLAAAMLLGGRHANAQQEQAKGQPGQGQGRPGGGKSDVGNAAAEFTGRGRGMRLMEAIEAAYLDAISNAKKGFGSELVGWAAGPIRCDSGGVVGDHNVVVTIVAESGPITDGRGGDKSQ